MRNVTMPQLRTLSFFPEFIAVVHLAMGLLTLPLQLTWIASDKICLDMAVVSGVALLTLWVGILPCLADTVFGLHLRHLGRVWDDVGGLGTSVKDFRMFGTHADFHDLQPASPLQAVSTHSARRLLRGGMSDIIIPRAAARNPEHENDGDGVEYDERV